MTTIKGTAPLQLTLEWNRSHDELIAFSDRISLDEMGKGLDSLDLGDSMGFWIEFALENGGDFTLIDAVSGGILQVGIEHGDGFSWEG